jgi:hypothetical protein
VNNLPGEGFARRQGRRIIFARDMLDTLKRGDLSDAAGKISAETGLAYRPSEEGEHVAGVPR